MEFKIDNYIKNILNKYILNQLKIIYYVSIQF